MTSLASTSISGRVQHPPMHSRATVIEYQLAFLHSPQNTRKMGTSYRYTVYSIPLRSRNQVITLFLSKHYFRNLKLKKTWIPALALTDGSPSRRDYSPFLPLARLWQTLSGHPIGINGSPSASFSNGIVTGKALVGYDDAFFLSFS